MATTQSLLQKLNPPLHPPIKNKPHPTTTSVAVAAASTTSRRSCIILAASSTLLIYRQLTISTKSANALDFRMTVPDQTYEEAESGIRSHAQSLLKVKDLLMAETWREAQKLLRKSSALLKQDIYTIIQGKPAAERPLLRKLYSELFNGVTRLDYAARDKDRTRVWQCYNGIVLSLNDVLSRV